MSTKALWEVVVLKCDVQYLVNFERTPCSLRLDEGKRKADFCGKQSCVRKKFLAAQRVTQLL